ncbi:Pimeloyl-ACP methyl ester carboxylesterase [Catalinimonas alkaloidigena]|uniref:Pimeloyl-ACP methyl ester carboxylesterase n=1 Tax=Catalinimonas alkaloidigena TaxID=1075417 RepID=A0A1G9TGP6_9BACT|nr:alpha/beta fold hydrolase [Catalinimonas alkaloidigena]SDM46887.1 Pimeloyl-ACP methyl ester carboxylesterase [Catalinimonas alkaloidigena]
MKNRYVSGLSTALLLCALTACDPPCESPHPPDTFVLVHGAWQAPYAWQFVEAQLNELGQKVVVVQLPAHGDDPTPPAETSMELYKKTVVSAIKKIPGKVILVGHSMGGAVVTAVAEQIPHKIDKLVYVGAFVPGNGQTLFELAAYNTESLLGPALEPSEDFLTFGIKSDQIVPIFIQDGSPALQQLVLDQYQPEPAPPFDDPIAVTDRNWGKVDKYFIHTLQDNNLGPDFQEMMFTAAGITRIYPIESGHCPFLSRPTETTTILLNISKLN